MQHSLTQIVEAMNIFSNNISYSIFRKFFFTDN